MVDWSFEWQEGHVSPALLCSDRMSCSFLFVSFVSTLSQVLLLLPLLHFFLSFFLSLSLSLSFHPFCSLSFFLSFFFSFSLSFKLLSFLKKNNSPSKRFFVRKKKQSTKNKNK